MDEDDVRDTLPICDGSVIGIEGADQERRIRREIANSNERRRMQSINAGFQSLRILLPHHEGEKLSKAAILQQTAEYIYTLEQEKTLLLSQNSQLKRLLSLSQQRLEGLSDAADSSGHSPPAPSNSSPPIKKKRNQDQPTSDFVVESVTTLGGEMPPTAETQTASTTDMNLQLLQEQRMRSSLEERVKSLERQLSLKAPMLPAPELPKPIVAANLSRDPTRSAPVGAPLPTPTAPTLLSTAPAPPPTAILLSTAAAAVKEASYPLGSRVDVDRISTLTRPPTLPSVPLPPQDAAAVSSEGPQELGGAVGKSYVVSNVSSRQNLDSIVEAIRHLEGDHLFSEDVKVNVKENSVKEEGVVDYSTAVGAVDGNNFSTQRHQEDTVSTAKRHDTSSSVIVVSSGVAPVSLPHHRPPPSLVPNAQSVAPPRIAMETIQLPQQPYGAPPLSSTGGSSNIILLKHE